MSGHSVGLASNKPLRLRAQIYMPESPYKKLERADSALCKAVRKSYDIALDIANDADGWIREGSETVAVRSFREIVAMVQDEMCTMLLDNGEEVPEELKKYLTL